MPVAGLEPEVASPLGETGLGDLLRVIGALRPGPATLAIAAELLGLARAPAPAAAAAARPSVRGEARADRPARDSPQPGSRRVVVRSELPAPSAELPASDRSSLPLSASYLAPRPPVAPRSARKLAELLPEGEDPPPFEGLYPPGQSRVLLSLLGSRRRRDGDVDSDLVVGKLARGDTLTELPRRWATTTRGDVQLALDTGPGMAAYQRDIDLLPDQLRSVQGADGLQLCWFEDCPLGGEGVRTPAALDRVPYLLPAAGTVVVAVTTFGVRGGMEPARSVSLRWHRLVASAAPHGVGVLALTPLPASSLPGGLPRRLRVVTWDRSARVEQLAQVVRSAARELR